MKVKQIAVFLENRSGRLADISHALARRGINIQRGQDIDVLQAVRCSLST